MLKFWTMIVFVILYLFFVHYMESLYNKDPCLQVKDKEACRWVQGKH